MLKKSRSKKFRNHGVLAKFPKKKQDLRVDLPTIGLETLKFFFNSGADIIACVRTKEKQFLEEVKNIQKNKKNKIQ